MDEEDFEDPDEGEDSGTDDEEARLCARATEISACCTGCDRDCDPATCAILLASDRAVTMSCARKRAGTARQKEPIPLRQAGTE
ncbi:MAG: hypothetical protein FWD68_17495 [Alphaproteobacteria bacterium]|nr:hypothetical protein [Alphaproteobacteria bacterium]